MFVCFFPSIPAFDVDSGWTVASDFVPRSLPMTTGNVNGQRMTYNELTTSPDDGVQLQREPSPNHQFLFQIGE